MNIQIESELRRLPEPVPPATLAASVMARVSRLADDRAAAPLASPARKDHADTEREAHRASWSELPSWVAALAGLAIVSGSWIYGQLDAGMSPDLFSSQVGVPISVRAPLNTSAALGLAMGLLLYVAGLFAPLRHRR